MSSRTPYLFAILIGSLDPFACLSEDEPPEFDPRLELCFSKIDDYVFAVSTEYQTENKTVNVTENETELDCEPD